MKPTLHVIGMPHTASSKTKYLHCGYTQKVVGFCRMMFDMGYNVIHYGGEGSDLTCTEHVTTVTTAQRDEWFYSNWDVGEFPDMEYNPGKPYWMEMNAKTVMAMYDRIKPHDFICLIAGLSQKPIADAFPDNITIEYGIGYEGVFSKFRCFESNAWRHHVYGIRGERDGSWYDTVIGNYYDPNDFPIGERKGDYYVFLGRLIQRKNPHVAADVCGRIGAKLIVAGQGVTYKEPGKICSREVTLIGDHVEHIGVVDVKGRAQLLGNAKAIFVLTQYIAPFEGVHAEAGLAGCPAITTDWGVFNETVENGVTGYRVHTIGEAMWAARNVDKLNPKIIREKSLAKFSYDAVAPKFDEWISRINGLQIPGKDFYDESPGRFSND